MSGARVKRGGRECEPCGTPGAGSLPVAAESLPVAAESLPMASECPSYKDCTYCKESK